MSSPRPTTFGRKEFHAAMLCAELEIPDVAALCGVTVRSVQRWLAGDKPIPIYARRLVRACALGLVSWRAVERL